MKKTMKKANRCIGLATGIMICCWVVATAPAAAMGPHSTGITPLNREEGERPVSVTIDPVTEPMAVAGVSPGLSDESKASGDFSESAEFDEAEFDEFDEFDEFGDDAASVAPRVPDPLYRVNRAIFAFNDRLYVYGVNPLASGYKAVMPAPVRTGLRHFFHNLMFPVRFVNNLLQGRLEQASDEFGIFLVNSTAGLLGWFPVAQTRLNMHTRDENFGQTLGRYRIKEGCYLVLPFLGPSTLRDLAGRTADYFITPLNYATPWELEWGASVTDIVNQASFRIGDYEALKAAALDPYTAFRDAYLQNKQSRITQ